MCPVRPRRRGRGCCVILRARLNRNSAMSASSARPPISILPCRVSSRRTSRMCGGVTTQAEVARVERGKTRGRRETNGLSLTSRSRRGASAQAVARRIQQSPCRSPPLPLERAALACVFNVDFAVFGPLRSALRVWHVDAPRHSRDRRGDGGPPRRHPRFSGAAPYSPLRAGWALCAWALRGFQTGTLKSALRAQSLQPSLSKRNSCHDLAATV